MLKIKNLKVAVWKKEILKWVNLNFELWRNYLIIWKNWSWKSTLANFIAWNPNYELSRWMVILEEMENIWDKNKKSVSRTNLLNLNSQERSKAGIFLSFQNIPEIEWIKLSEYLRIIYNIHLKNKNPEAKDISPFIFRKHVKKFLDELDISEKFLDRDLNVGFSWWEKRKVELLQVKLIEPSYIILDEIDSWLDPEAFQITANLLKKMSNENNTFIIITHQYKILDYLDVDEIFVMENGKIVDSWGKELIEKIRQKSFE